MSISPSRMSSRIATKVTVTPMRPSSGRNSCMKGRKPWAPRRARMSLMRSPTESRSRCTWWWANICARTTTSLNASSISWSVICGSARTLWRSLSGAEAGHTSRSRRGRASIPSAARLKRSYSCRRRTSSARGSSSPSSSSFGRGSSMRDLISARVAAITRYSPASSSCRSAISSMYCMYWRVISASGMSRMSRFWRRIRYSSRSSGPSKASRNTSSACGGMYRSRGSCETGSPLTTAKGISTCSGCGSVVSATGAGLETTIFRSGRCFMRSVRAQVHGAAHLIEGLARDLARLVGALGDDVAHQLRVVLEFLGALSHAADLLHHLIDEGLLALKAADTGAAAARRRPLARGLIGIDLVQVPNRALVRVTRIGAPHARRVGLHGAQLLHHLIGLLAQTDGVAVGLGHLAPVEPRDLRRLRQQHLRLGQDRHPGTLEEAEQALAVGHRDAIVTLHQRLGALQRLLVAGLLELAAQLFVGGAVATPQALHRALGLGLEVRLLAIDVVEAPRGLARELHVRHLVLPHWHEGGAVDEDVGALQQRVAKESVGREVLLLQLLLLVLVARHALEPAERGDHREQEVQFCVLGHVRLDEESGDPGVQPRGQPVDEHVAHVLLQARGVLVAGGEHVPVGDEEITLVLVLQLDPVAQRPVVVAEVQPPGGTHAREHAPRRRR